MKDISDAAVDKTDVKVIDQIHLNSISDKYILRVSENQFVALSEIEIEGVQESVLMKPVTNQFWHL